MSKSFFLFTTALSAVFFFLPSSGLWANSCEKFYGTYEKGEQLIGLYADPQDPSKLLVWGGFTQVDQASSQKNCKFEYSTFSLRAKVKDELRFVQVPSYACDAEKLTTQLPFTLFNMPDPQYAYVLGKVILEHYLLQGSELTVENRVLNYYSLSDTLFDRPQFDVNHLPPGAQALSPGILQTSSKEIKMAKRLGSWKKAQEDFIKKFCAQGSPLEAQNVNAVPEHIFLSEAQRPWKMPCEGPFDLWQKLAQHFERVKKEQCAQFKSVKEKLSSKVASVCQLPYLPTQELLAHLQKEFKRQCSSQKISLTK